MLCLLCNELNVLARRVEFAPIGGPYDGKKGRNSGESKEAESVKAKPFDDFVTEKNLSQCRTDGGTACKKSEKVTCGHGAQNFCKEAH